jgi:chromosome segregation ATPase
MMLDFPYTCPTIDKHINKAEETIKYEVQEIFDLYAEDIPPQRVRDLVERYVSIMSEVVRDGFENVRSCNEKLRVQAEKQIEELQDQIDDLNGEIAALGELHE